jgi:hypothetical protein
MVFGILQVNQVGIFQEMNRTQLAAKWIILTTRDRQCIPVD